MWKVKIALAAVLSAFAMGMASSSSASATGVVVWGREICASVPFGRGGFTAGCVSPFAGGEAARSIVWPNGLAFFCLWIGLGSGMLADPGCIFLGIGGGYGVFPDAPAFSVKIKGGAYKFEGKVGSTSTTIACTAMQAAEPDIESGGGEDGGKPGMLSTGSLEFSGCKPSTPANCEVGTLGKVAGNIDTNAILGAIVENAARTKVEELLKPKTGNVLTELEFKGSSCSLKGEKPTIEGKTLTSGGAEDEISKELKIVATEKPEDDDLVEPSVEKVLLISEPSSKSYLNDETGATEEAKLTLDKEPLKLLGEASMLGKVTATTVKDEETSEEVLIKEEVVDLGLGRE